MLKERKDKRHRTKYPARIFGALILSIFIVAVITHLWLIPAKVSREIERALLKFWDGQVDIEDIDINYFDPIYLTEVSFSDKTGREYMHTGKVRMVFEKWPGLHPVVTEVEIEKLCLQLSTVDGKFTFPVKNPHKQPRSPRKKVDIRKLSINDIEIILTDPQDKKYLYDNLQFQANKNGSLYNFSLNRDSAEPSESLLAKGRIDSKTLETELSLKIEHTVKSPETALVFAALNIPALSAEGKLAADLTMTGCLKQPAALKPTGTIKLDEWTVAKNDKTIVNNFTTKVNIKDGQFVFENMTAVVFNGSTIGSLYFESRQDGPTIFSGNILARKMDFVELSSVIGGPGRKATRGSVSFSYNFTGEGTDLQNLVGRGHLYLDDSDITVIPVVPHIFRVLGLSRFDPLDMSDAGCTFTTAGPVVTFEAAHVANFFAAVKAEPGGTINLQTKQIDMYVVAVPLKQIDAAVRQVPFADIFVNLKDKLTRLRVRGCWSDAPAKLITKEPIKDVKKAAVGFFQDIMETPGRITQQISEGLGIFLKPGNSEQPATD